MNDSRLISPEYRAIQEKAHNDGRHYGIQGHLFAGHVQKLAEGIAAKSILDYGCGKRTLEKAMLQKWKGAPVCEWTNYDPCIPEFANTRKPAELVVCTDVMEHIEPDLVDNVLRDIASLTLKAAFFSIANRPATRILSDGRNAHLIQKPYTWWIQKLANRFRVKAFEILDSDDDREFWLICDYPK